MRKCLPLTTLSQKLVENSFLSECVREELLINETERKMIYGTPLPGWARPGSGVADFSAMYGTNTVNYSALEQRVLDSMVQSGSRAILSVPRGIGKTSYLKYMLQKLAELGKVPPYVVTNAEISRGFPSPWERVQTRESFPQTFQLCAVRDAVATAKHYTDQYSYNVRRENYGDEVYADHVMQKNRRFVLNFDQLGGGKCDSRNSTGARHLAETRTTSSLHHQQHWPSRTFLRSTASSSM